MSISELKELSGVFRTADKVFKKPTNNQRSRIIARCDMQFIKNLFRTLKTAKRAMNFNFNQVGNSWNPQLLPPDAADTRQSRKIDCPVQGTSVMTIPTERAS